MRTTPAGSLAAPVTSTIVVPEASATTRVAVAGGPFDRVGATP